MKRSFYTKAFLLLFAFLLIATSRGWSQLDQGSITGVVQDSTGAVIPNADLQLTDTATGLQLKAKSDGSGVFSFSPIKIGSYTILAKATGFESVKQENITVNIQSRVNVPIVMAAGGLAQSITVNSTPPALQTQDASVAQVMTAATIDHTPLNGRNYVYIAQLANGTAPAQGSRGGGSGDFEANGQRAEENNFILDGVDNNVNVVDFANGASYNVQPPPDALAEFSVQTSDYSAEFGHSAGAVVNASIKSGSNAFHGDLWEYFRNNILDARDFDAQTIPKYRENQFGATLGGPIIHNKLFFFGDVQANRIIFGETNTLTVPTALMRTGNFSELLNTGLTGGTQAVQLYQPNSGGATKLACNGVNNVFCANQLSPLALKIVNMYPQPNANGGETFNNYIVNRDASQNTITYDGRVDYNLSSKDQAFSRFSYAHLNGFRPPPLGNVLDGGSYGDDGNIFNKSENFVFSESHVFSANLTNEFRFGYNYLHTGFSSPLEGTDIASQVGLGGIPFGAGFPDNGGLPLTNLSGGNITGIAAFGVPGFIVTDEHENVYQILDNVTKVVGNHTLKFGVSFQSLRFETLQPSYPKGTYTYNGLYTGSQGASYTGFGLADFEADQLNSASVSNVFKDQDSHWYRSAYAEDDWRATPSLTLNLGLRYDFYQPYKEVGGNQAAYYPTGPLGVGTGSAAFLLPSTAINIPLSPTFTSLLTKDNISLQYVKNNPALVNAQNLNFGPRIGVAYKINDKDVVRAGYGIFFGGLESTGYYPNLGENYPFQFQDNFNAANCGTNNCPSLTATSNINLETGFTDALTAGLQNFVSLPSLRGSDHNVKTPYTESYNLAVEHSITNSVVANISYVGDVSRHLVVFPDPNNSEAITNPSTSVNPTRPFPDFGGTAYSAYAASSNYNSFQAKIEKRYSAGSSLLATYTYAHALDDAPTPLGSTGDSGYRNTNLIPLEADYASSPFDYRQRVTVNAFYELPFGKGRQYMNNNGILNEVAGGWATNLTFQAETGQPFTVAPDITGANGIGTRAVVKGNPYRTGGTPDPSNPNVTCATKTHTLTHWYNPCQFVNPLAGSLISPGAGGPNGTDFTTPQAGYAYPAYVTNHNDVLAFAGGVRDNVYGPGYEQINMSLFKNFTTIREQFLQFRADAFNLLNTPAYGQPSTADDSTKGGLINSPKTFQSFTPAARFFQLSLKYQF
jgi:hypothetical protein